MREEQLGAIICLLADVGGCPKEHRDVAGAWRLGGREPSLVISSLMTRSLVSFAAPKLVVIVTSGDWPANRRVLDDGQKRSAC